MANVEGSGVEELVRIFERYGFVVGGISVVGKDAFASGTHVKESTPSSADQMALHGVIAAGLAVGWLVYDVRDTTVATTVTLTRPLDADGRVQRAPLDAERRDRGAS